MLCPVNTAIYKHTDYIPKGRSMVRAKRLPLGLQKTKHRKVMKRFMIIVLALFVIFSQMSLSPFLGQASAEDTQTQQIIDSVGLTTGEGDAAKEVNTENPLKQGDAVNLDYTWTQKDGQKLDQDVTIQIPAQFKVGTKDDGDKDSTDTTGEVKLADNTTVIGSYTIKASDQPANANQLTIHFNSEKTKDLSGATGNLRIPAVFDDDIKADQKITPIDFDLGNNQKQTINVAVKAEATTEKSEKADHNATATDDQGKTTDGSSTEDQAKAEKADTDAESKDASSAGQAKQEAVGDSGAAAKAENQKESVASVQTAPEKKQTKSIERAAAEAKASTPQEITKPVVSVDKITDKDGNVWSSEHRPGLESEAYIHMNWSIEDDWDIHEGDYYTFDLPQEFAIYNDFNGELKDDDGNVVANYMVKHGNNDTGKVTLTFTNYAERHSNVGGTFTVFTKFNKETITGSTQKEIKFDLPGDAVTVTIPFENPKGTAIHKDVSPDRSVNPKNINWTVNINTNEATLKNAVVKDPTPAGLTLNKDSIKLYQLQVNVDGTVKLGSQVPSSDYELGTDDGNLTIKFNQDINRAYQIQYSTKINDSSKKGTFKNTATLSSDGNEDVKASASITTKLGTHLTKTGSYDSNTQTIKWTINYNGDEQSIKQADAVLHDLFDNSHELDSSSVKVYQATVKDDGGFTQGSLVDNSEYEVTPKSTTDKNGFDLQFKHGIDSAYQITYTTKAVGLVTEDGKISNTVTSDNSSASGNEQYPKQQGIIKSNTGADYKAKTATWKITVNGNHYELNNATITDTFDHAGLALKENAFKIHNETKDKDPTKGTDYDLSSDANGFVVTFKGAYAKTTDSFTITYTTDFDYNKLASGKTVFSNTSKLTWKDENGKDQSSSSTATFNPDDYTKSNGFKSGSYDPSNKQITWKIGINYNNVTLKDPKIVDQIKDNQQYIDGSLEVHTMTLTGGWNGYSVGEDVPEDDYTVEYPSAANDNTLTVHFKKAIDSPYYMTFKTSLNGQIIHKAYDNTALVLDGADKVTDLSASVQPTNGDSFASKSGAQDGNYVNWTVNINPSQSSVSEPVLTDTPSNNQIIDASSFELYKATVNRNGTLTKTGEPLKQGTDYTRDVHTDNDTGAQSFTLAFKNAINDAYLLTYRTLINASNGDKLENTVKLDGKNIQTYTTETSSEVTVKLSGGDGTGSGEIGGLTITKKDADDGSALSGATFTLYDKEGKTALRTITTDNDGKAAFNHFKYGDYVLKEDKAPTGYVINPDYKAGKTVTIDKPAKGETTTQLAVVNHKFVGKVILTKQDDVSGEKLKNAVFELKDQDGKLIEQLTTDENGQLTADNLKPGNYQLVEIIPPANYQLNSTPYAFTINEDQTTVINVTAKNTLTPGSVVLTKTDEDTGKTLSGAVFNLVQNGNVLQSGLTTNAAGQIEVNDLVPGDYQFVETSAPNDYALISGSAIPFTIQKGQVKPLQISATNGLITGSVELTKVDSDNHDAPLTGATFDLQNQTGETLKSGLHTDSKGKLTVDNLKPGDYQFMETKAPAGYVLNPEPIKFTIEKSQKQPLKINAPNALQTGSVILNKVGEDNAELGLQGAKYTLKDATGHVIKEDLQTNDKGQIIYEGLKPGNYQFVETQAPTGYEVDATPITFTITKGQTEVVQKKAIDKLIPGDAVLTKVDSADPNQTLEGAVFNLEDAHGSIIKQDLTTDANGKIAVTNLKPGTYYFTETKAPANYDLNNERIKVVIEKGQQVAAEVTAENTLTPGSAKLIKKATEDQSLLQGAEYKLIRVDNSGHQIWVKEHLVTNEYGQIVVNNLVPGHYQFIETKAPTNYDLNAAPIPVTVAPGQKSVDEATVVAHDTLTPGNAEVFKKDEVSGEGLKGAVFNVLDRNGDAVRTSVTTDQNGKLLIKDLAPGNYQLVETQAPAGYLKNSKAVPFEIKKGQLSTYAVPVDVTNKMVPGSLTLKKADGDHPDKALSGAVFKLLNAKGEAAKDNDGQPITAEQLTTKDGKMTLNNLRPGTYTLEETTPAPGYIRNTSPLTFTIDPSATNQPTIFLKKTFENYKGKAELTKTDADGHGLEGAEFKVVDQDDQVIQKDLKTDTNGKISVGNLKPGKYNFVETKAPNGYLLDSAPKRFTIDDQTSGQPTVVSVSKVNTLNKVVLTKVDKNDPDAVLKGAEFKLVGKDGKIVEKDVTGKELPTVWTTDDHGQFMVNGLATGEYSFIETKAPNGYELDATPIPFKVTNEDAKAIPITATDKLNSVVLTKVDKNDPDAVLKGAEFKLYDSTGKMVEKDANGKALPSVWSTNDKGQFTVSGLAPGNYHFIETKAPKNYDLDETPIPFHVTATDVKAIAITAADLLTPGGVRLTKVDRNDPDAVLKGAEFKLVDGNGKTLKTGLTTDNSGRFVVKDLAPGQYAFIETKAPEGYQLDATPIPFVIEKGISKPVEITATNKAIPTIERGVLGEQQNGGTPQPKPVIKKDATSKNTSSIERGQLGLVETASPKSKKDLPKTGDSNHLATFAAGAALLIGGAFLTIFSRRRKKG
ncbi:hypothetical protein C0674_14800 [Sporolactobacillus terrae]|uniref:Gram-positive cocci surface proteins LPxTG domain-containing protein n=2 Tax=Sporolactobacillus terrae TaxID=269673 RepID=A0ABX5QAV7_9BACL|nr:hypothetical protein C0674_14800 [Sporolactobacillus terrae]QAA26725.1 hypothetical protein C0679_14785 [Sporolactobacillus terrae]